MTYLESAEDILISKARAFQELNKHGVMREDRLEFLMDMIKLPNTKLDSEGHITHMDAQDVLVWLGY